jgi:sensor histidine kinase YesM
MKLDWHKYLVHLPVLVAVLVDVHIRFFSFRSFGSDVSIVAGSTHFGTYEYLLISCQQLLESLPFFLAAERFHHYCFTHKLRAVVWLLLGFVVYPVFSTALAYHWTLYDEFTLINPQAYTLAFIATLMWWLQRFIYVGKQQRFGRWINYLFSLNGVVISLLGMWTILMTGIFHNTDEPMRNMPLDPVIDLMKIKNDFLLFLNYLWQFSFIAILMFAYYFFIRKILIRELLAKHGVIAFLLAAILSTIVVTPLAGSLVLLLPINIDSMTLLVSTDHDVFGKDNYLFSLILLSISVPLILAFDRQQQTALLAQTAAQQTKTELKLLQQQINPHFLFNTLNNLYALTLKKSNDASKAVMQLSNLLRYTVYKGQYSKVYLFEEIDYIENYLALQQIRLGERCKLTTRWPDDETIKHIKVIPLLFIVLIENAFKHGVEKREPQSYVSITLEANKHLKLEMLNSLPQLTEKHMNEDVNAFSNLSEKAGQSGNGLGLVNLRRRLDLVYPNQYRLISEKKNERTWRTVLELKCL